MKLSLCTIAFLSSLSTGVLFTRPSAGGELESLIEEYNAAKPKARDSSKGGKGGWKGGGPPGGRWNRQRPESPLKPILMAIAALGTPPAQAFIQGEYLKERPDIAVVCVEPLLTFQNEKVLDVLFTNFSKRDRTVKEEVLTRLADSKRDISSLEGTLIGLLQTELLPEVRRDLPRLLGRIGTLASAKALILSLKAGSQSPRSGGNDPQRQAPPPFGGGGGGPGGGGPGGPGGGGPGGGWGRPREPELDFGRKIVRAFKETQREDVKAWFGNEAFSGAPPARVAVLADLAGELKLEAARPHLEKHLEALEEDAGLRCLAALIAIGTGPSEGRIIDVIKKGKCSIACRIQALDHLAASGTPAGLAAVKAAAQDGNSETRAIALGSLARVPGANEEAFQAIVAGLKDADPLVRGAALRALQNLRHKSMVPALIDLLAHEKDERVQVNALQLLVEVTGKNMGLSADDWRKWWEVTEPTFQFSTEKVDKQITAARAHDLKYFGVEVGSKRLAFLIDASLSMEEQMDVFLKQEKKPEEAKTKAGLGGGSGEDKDAPRTRARRIDVLKREMVRVVNGLPKDTQLNIITFAQSPKAWQETLQPIAGAGREKVLSFVRDITLGFGTNVYDTLELALKDKRVDTVFLLTDGEPTSGKHTDPPSIIREVQALNRVRGVTIHCVAFGEESEFLKTLAEQNGGVYRFVNTY